MSDIVERLRDPEQGLTSSDRFHLHKDAAAEIERLRAGIHRYLSGDWMKRPFSKLDKCEHGRFGYEDCGCCIDKYFANLLGPEPGGLDVENAATPKRREG